MRVTVALLRSYLVFHLVNASSAASLAASASRSAAAPVQTTKAGRSQNGALPAPKPPSGLVLPSLKNQSCSRNRQHTCCKEQPSQTMNMRDARLVECMGRVKSRRRTAHLDLLRRSARLQQAAFWISRIRILAPQRHIPCSAKLISNGLAARLERALLDFDVQPQKAGGDLQADRFQVRIPNRLNACTAPRDMEDRLLQSLQSSRYIRP